MAVRKIVKGFLSELERQLDDQGRLVKEMKRASLTTREYDYLYKKLLKHPRMLEWVKGLVPIIIAGGLEVLKEMMEKGLRGMTEYPKVEARATRSKDGIWDLWITCPYCGKKHHHGGGSGEEPMYGFRAPHCDDIGAVSKDQVKDYELVPE